MPARLPAAWNDEDIQKPYSFGLAAQSDSRFNLACEGYCTKFLKNVSGNLLWQVYGIIGLTALRLYVSHIAEAIRRRSAAADGGVVRQA